MKKIILVITIISGISAALCFGWIFLLPFLLMHVPCEVYKSENASGAIGVIGGADGPTVIYMSDGFHWLQYVSAICFLLIFVISLVLLKKTSNKG